MYTVDRTMENHEYEIKHDPSHHWRMYIQGVAHVASDMWTEGLCSSPFAFVVVLRIALETTCAIEGGYVEAAKHILYYQGLELRRLIVSGAFD